MQATHAKRGVCIWIRAGLEEQPHQSMACGGDGLVQHGDTLGGAQLQAGAAAYARLEVRAVLDEHLRRGELLALTRPEERPHALAVARVDVGARGEEQLHRREVSGLAGFVQRRRAVPFGVFGDEGAGGDEERDGGVVALLRGVVERCAVLLLRARLEAGVVGDQGAQDVGVAV